MVHPLRRRRRKSKRLNRTHGYKLVHSKLDQADNLDNIMICYFGSLSENGLAGTTDQENVTCVKEDLWEGWTVYSRREK